MLLSCVWYILYALEGEASFSKRYLDVPVVCTFLPAAVCAPFRKQATCLLKLVQSNQFFLLGRIQQIITMARNGYAKGASSGHATTVREVKPKAARRKGVSEKVSKEKLEFLKLME